MMPAGVGGAGGGAVYLLAGTAININAYINASGAPGGESGLQAGGSGGGSGGMIVLFAPTIAAASGVGVIAGGGPGAAGGAADVPGQRGGEADPEYPQAPVEGGNGAQGCPNGANAYDSTSPNPTSGRTAGSGLGSCGGGGASGGGGYIRSNVAIGDAFVVPPPDIVQ
jgi:hypothetical protein